MNDKKQNQTITDNGNRIGSSRAPAGKKISIFRETVTPILSFTINDKHFNNLLSEYVSTLIV